MPRSRYFRATLVLTLVASVVGGGFARAGIECRSEGAVEGICQCPPESECCGSECCTVPAPNDPEKAPLAPSDSGKFQLVLAATPIVGTFDTDSLGTQAVGRPIGCAAVLNRASLQSQHVRIQT